jgi:(R,R)-butanediol dehydrogenase / meso-butanediol dehydrogenase / diacetyl reductase
MKALRWHARKDVRYEDVPEPVIGPEEVKVKVNLAGICGSDLNEYVGGPRVIRPASAPIIVGHEFAGRIVELGKGVTGFKVGERVTGLCYWACGACYFCKKALYNLCLRKGVIGASTDGCMAEYIKLPPFSLYKLPDSVPDEMGALVEPLSVSTHAVHKGNVGMGDRVAVVGDGAIGLCALLAAKAAGAAEVYFVAKHPRRGELAAAMGASAVINLADGDPALTVKKLTGGIGADVAIDCAGRPDATLLALRSLSPGGTSVIVAAPEKPLLFDFNMLGGEKTIVSSSVYIDEFAEVISLLADGRIDVRPLITSTVPMKDAIALGFEKLLANKEENVKILLRVA